MSMYASVTGTLVRISWPRTENKNLGCTMTLTLQSEDQGTVRVSLSASAYVLDGKRFAIGDRVTCFYSAAAPVPLVYPPLYQAVAAAHTPSGTTAVLDVFDDRLMDSEGKLKLNLAKDTQAVLPNGQLFAGYLAQKTLLVLYTSSTKSLPAQASPKQIVVFCQEPEP